jgi:Putative prokaryotic signal transducing protein
MADFMAIEQVGNEAIAEMLKQRLEDAGIPCAIAPTTLAAVAGAGAGYAVSVPHAQVEAARALLGDGQP